MNESELREILDREFGSLPVSIRWEVDKYDHLVFLVLGAGREDTVTTSIMLGHLNEEMFNKYVRNTLKLSCKYVCAEADKVYETTSIIDEVKELLTERAKTHGEPEQNFQMIADIWSALLSKKLKEYEVIDIETVGILMASLKFARQMSTEEGSRDNMLDALGYISLVSDIEGV